MKIKTILISLLFVPFLAFAKNGAVLPSAGFTPESPFYFLDKLGEALQRFFTFNPESRAKLEITFAKERVAEIKVILENKGVSAKGLGIAEERLGDNLSRATTILANQNREGKDTSNLARDLSDEFNPARGELKSTFKSEADTLDAKIDGLKAKRKDARLAGDTAQVETLTKEIADLKAQKELLEQHGDKDDGNIEEENEHFDEALGLQKEVAEKIKDAEEEKVDILKEAEEYGLEVPDEAFKKFDALLSQAKIAFDAGNYEDAKDLAQDAKHLVKEDKKKFKEAEKNLEELQERKETEGELKEETDDQKRELGEKLKKATEEVEKEEQPRETISTPKPSIAPSSISADDIQGIWIVGDSKTYYEFKEGQMCGGQLDNNNLPEPCTSSQPFSISGATLTLGPNAFTLKWIAKPSKLELFLPLTDQKVVLSKFVRPIVQPSAPKDYSITLTPDQLKLQGVWKNSETGNYISFKFYRFTWQGNAGSGEWCQEVIISGSITTCKGYTEFTLSGNIIHSGSEIESLPFVLQDEKLTLMGGEGKFGGDSTYTKTALPLPPFKGVVED